MANLLIVDDNIEATKPLAMILRFFKHQVDCAASGNEALIHLAGKLPDVVVLDIMMPGMDGMEVLRRIRSDARTARLAVVMYSAVSDPTYRDAAIQKGADDYLVKGSVQVEDLRKRMEHWAMTGHAAPTLGPGGGTSSSSISYS